MLGLSFRSLCTHMTGIDLSPYMVDRAAERGCYNVLAVGNAESVVLIPIAEDLLPALNAPRYNDVKVKVVSVNFNRSRGINENGRCGGGGGGSKKEKNDD